MSTGGRGLLDEIGLQMETIHKFDVDDHAPQESSESNLLLPQKGSS
jgi:hypothetical protein